MSLHLQEELSVGQLVNEFRLLAEVDGAWHVLLDSASVGTAIGHKRIWMAISGLQRATRLRLTVLSSFAWDAQVPRIRRIALYDHSRAQYV